MGKLITKALITTYRILDATILNADVDPAAAIDFSKLAALASAKILVGNASNVPTAVDISGDITIDNAGATAIGAAKVTSSKLDPSTVQYATVEISSAELLALVATPKTLVAAPGEGKILEFISCELAYDKGSVTYTIGNATNLQAKLGAVAVSCLRAVTGFLDQAGDKVFYLTPVGVAAIDLSTVVNTALSLTLASSDGEMSAGNGTVHAKVAYRVLATGL